MSMPEEKPTGVSSQMLFGTAANTANDIKSI